MLAVNLEDWQVALFGFFGFVIVLVLIVKLWRDPTLRKVRVGVYIEREPFDEWQPRTPEPPADEQPTEERDGGWPRSTS